MPRSKAPTELGARVNDLIRFKGLSPEQAIQQVLGSISTTAIPQGSKIIAQSATYLEYEDPQGFRHRLQRNGDATSENFGQLTESTDRPPVLGLTQQFPGLEGTLNQAMEAVRRGLGGQLSQLTPEDQELLNTITQATQQQLNQQFTRQGGELVTQLFGRGVQQSSLAGQATADLLQSQGLVQNQALSDAARRNLDIRQFLTNLSTGTGANILGTITGQETQRGIASGQLGLGQRELDQQMIQFLKNLALEREKLDVARRGQNRSLLSSIANAAATVAGGFIGG